ITGNRVDRARGNGFFLVPDEVEPLIVSSNRAYRNGGFGFIAIFDTDLPGRGNRARDNGLGDCGGVVCRR
ncbi:MAG: hypothetical protein RLZZ272_1386, partial [Actinomycetota bacterium]